MCKEAYLPIRDKNKKQKTAAMVNNIELSLWHFIKATTLKYIYIKKKNISAKQLKKQQKNIKKKIKIVWKEFNADQCDEPEFFVDKKI